MGKDVKSLVKKLKNLPTAALIGAIASLSPSQYQQMQTLLNTAIRIVGEQEEKDKIRQMVREEVRKVINDMK